MAINIKNERTVAVVRQLAAHYGVSYSAAIEAAAEAVFREPRGVEADALERVRQITTDYRSNLPVAAVLDTDALYDENGLPK